MPFPRQLLVSPRFVRHTTWNFRVSPLRFLRTNANFAEISFVRGKCWIWRVGVGEVVWHSLLKPKLINNLWSRHDIAWSRDSFSYSCVMNAFTSFGWRSSFIREFVLLWSGLLFHGTVFGMAGNAVSWRRGASAIIKWKRCGYGCGSRCVCEWGELYLSAAAELVKARCGVNWIFGFRWVLGRWRWGFSTQSEVISAVYPTSGYKKYWNFQ